MTDQDEILARIAALRKTADELEQGLEAKPTFADLVFTVRSGYEVAGVCINGDLVLTIWRDGTVNFLKIWDTAAKSVLGYKLRQSND